MGVNAIVAAWREAAIVHWRRCRPPRNLLLDQPGNQLGGPVLILGAPHINVRPLEIEMHQPPRLIEDRDLGGAVFDEGSQSCVADLSLPWF